MAGKKRSSRPRSSALGGSKATTGRSSSRPDLGVAMVGHAFMGRAHSNAYRQVNHFFELPYRVVLLSTGDLGFAAAKCYDLEVWAPVAEKWLEVSSCSNFKDFQARRIGLKFKRSSGGKPELVHTLNASGVALPRIVIALWENFQDEKGSLHYPKALQEYLK